MVNRIWDTIQRVKEQSPLVHNITNYVVMNNTANALLAAGASPIMAHALEEIEDMVCICGATVINIGTLDRFTIAAMKTAIRKANELSKPVVLDPVGAGASAFRNQALEEILQAGNPQYIRGNASEIRSLAGLSTNSKGVDSTESSLNSLSAAQELCRKHHCIVCVSGATDIVTDGARTVYLNNGSPLMEKVTGLGCTATALLGAFAAVSSDPFDAAISATAFMGICGEIAAEKSNGPGTLQLHLYDTMYNLILDEYALRIQIKGDI